MERLRSVGINGGDKWRLGVKGDREQRHSGRVFQDLPGFWACHLWDTSRKADVPDTKGGSGENTVEEVSGGLDCSILGWSP